MYIIMFNLSLVVINNYQYLAPCKVSYFIEYIKYLVNINYQLMNIDTMDIDT